VLVTSFSVALSLWPAAAAQAKVAPPSGATLTVDHVRSSFATAGFHLDPVHDWSWTSPPVSTLQVHDRANGRVLLALVYPSLAAAQTARFQVEAREQQGNAGNGYGPQMVAGFGHSFWHGNVALLQTTQSELDRISGLQDDCDNGAVVATHVLRDTSPPSAVDYDFQQALGSSAFLL
jgi:hypothetical protein